MAQFVEQPRVLDSDDRLIAESFSLCDFSGSECVRSRSRQPEHADAISLTQQRQVER